MERVKARTCACGSEIGTVLAPNTIAIIDRIIVRKNALLKDTVLIIILEHTAVKLIYFNELGLRAIISPDEFPHHRSGRFLGVSPG